MNHLLKNSAALIAVLAGLSACQQELLPVDEGTKGNTTIIARTESLATTRTCIGGATSDGRMGVMWSPGDCIGVYGSGGTQNALFSTSISGSSAEALFSGNLKQGESPVYAYYPYSADNASADASAIKGNLKLQQSFNRSTGTIEADYKVGTPMASTTGNDNGYEFTFEHLFSLLQFNIDATGTALEGDKLESIIITLPDSRRLGGEFTFNAASKEVAWVGQAEGANQLTMDWTDTPTLSSGASYTGYITCAPEVRTGDPIKITILTSRLKAEFTRTALTDFEANTSYTFPLTLSNYAADMTVSERPKITAFSFATASNEGKILSTKLVYANGTTAPTTIAEEAMTVGDNSITGCIPYLYDFKLKPTFEVADGMTVTVGGQVQTSGESEQDFSQPVVYTVSNGTDSRDYIVEVTNSGLPVVVLTQEGGNVTWDEAGITVKSKDSDWGTADRLSVYKADGTVDVDNAVCGSRLRGNSTQNFPKLPFAIKLDKKASVLGMPKHKRWVLLANWMDRTMLRNSVAFDIAHKTADASADGLGWNPHGYNVELVMNGRHVGNYYLCEQIKIDSERVNIKDCYEDVVDGGNANPTVADCGYLLEFDDAMDEVNNFRTDRGLPVMFKDEVNTTLFNAVKQKIETIEANIESGNYTAAYEQLDINSVIDYFLVQELTFNDEYKHPKSVYMYIDGDGKLTAGPVWDFDWQTFVIPSQVRAYNGAYDCRDTDEWLYGGSQLASSGSSWPWGSSSPDYVNDKPYMWYPLLFKDATFRSRVQERWSIIYPSLIGVVNTIDELAEENRISDSYNFAMWPTTRALKNACGSAFNGDEEMSFDESIQSLKKAYTDRLEWMNSQITGGVFVTNAK